MKSQSIVCFLSAFLGGACYHCLQHFEWNAKALAQNNLGAPVDFPQTEPQRDGRSALDSNRGAFRESVGGRAPTQRLRNTGIERLMPEERKNIEVYELAKPRSRQHHDADLSARPISDVRSTEPRAQAPGRSSTARATFLQTIT